jgi:hypothetical protein
MTHTLHREGTVQNLSDDYVVFAMSAKGLNEQGSASKLRQFLDIVLQHNPSNYGDMKTGNALTRTYDEICDGIQDVSIVHAVFTDPDQVASVLRDLQEADLGVSVVVSGLVEPAAQCCQAAGLHSHTVEYSLGVWGNTRNLPEPAIREVTTMCGHGQVAFALVKHLVKEIKRGKTSCSEAARELAKPCVCGVFNISRAEKLLRKLSES